MTNATSDTTPETEAIQKKDALEHETEGAIAGAMAGAALGAIAGPPGAIAGAALGAMVGVVAGAVMDHEGVLKGADDRRLDAEIGVSGGELGAPNLEHPPATVGAYSGGSSGASSSAGETSAEGPLQSPPA